MCEQTVQKINSASEMIYQLKTKRINSPVDPVGVKVVDS